MVGVKIVGDITVLACPCLEGFELTLRLAHVAVEVVEVAEVASLGACIGVGWVEPFVVLDVHKYVVFPGFLEQGEVVGEELGCGLGNEDVDAALDGVQGDGEVGGVWGEDGDGGTGLEGIDGRLVGFRVGFVVCGE